MEAVSTNLGVDASKLSIQKKKEEAKRKRSRSRERARVSPKREARSSPTKPVKQEADQPQPAPILAEVKTDNGIKPDPEPAPAQPIQPPPTIPAESFSQPAMTAKAGVGGAQSKAQQIELEKCNGFQRRLIYQTAREKYKDLSLNSINNSKGDRYRTKRL